MRSSTDPGAMRLWAIYGDATRLLASRESGMTRAYHRVDPLMDERKSHYTPAQLGAFIKVQLMAGRQTKPGHFRSVDLLRRSLPNVYAKHLDFLIEQGDLVTAADGDLYVDGWKEWQEGDLTVGERMARLRNRRRIAAVTETVNKGVSQPSPAAIGIGVGIGVSSIAAAAASSEKQRARGGMASVGQVAHDLLESRR